MKTEEITLLGKNTDYVQHYAPELLESLPRTRGRDEIKIKSDSLPFSGFDLWTGFELSWLNDKGKPVVAIAEFFHTRYQPKSYRVEIIQALSEQLQSNKIFHI